MSFRKTMASVLSSAMIFGCVQAGAYTISGDVTGTNYEEAAYVLGALNIMVGDAGSGNFRPNDNITRAEFAKVAVAAVGLTDTAIASAGATNYSDVPADHWATGYIKVATDQKLIIGRENGTFGPEDPISYQDAVTILVRAIGHEPATDSKGGYPQGHLAVASQVGLTKNASGNSTANVNRGTVANLTNNALTIDMMEQVSYGSDVKYEVVDKTLLEDKLDVETGKGTVTANAYSTLEGASGLNKNSVRIDETTYRAGKSNAGDYLGYYVTYYAKDDESGLNKELLLVRPEKTRNTSVEIDADNISSVSATELSYWKDKDKDNQITKEKIADKAIMIYNGIAVPFDTALISSGMEGYVKLLETTGDGKHDVVFVHEFENIVVEDVLESTHKVVDKYGKPTLTLDPDASSYSFELRDTAGKEFKLPDLNEWDVLSVETSKDKSLYTVTRSTKSVSGKVSEVSEDKYKIDGEYYQISASYDKSIKLEDEGVFYLDMRNKISAVNQSSTIARNYAYLINAGVEGTIDSAVNFKLLKTDNTVITVTAEEKIRFDGTSGTTAEDALKKLQSDGKVKSQLVSYELNTNGKLIELETAEDKTGGSLTVDKYDFVKNFKADDVVYKENSKKLGKINVTDKTLVFDIPAGNTDYTEYAVRGIDMFENDSTYNIEVFDLAEDLAANVVIVSNSDGKTNMESPISVVTRITDIKNEDGEAVQKLYVLQNGEEKEFETDARGVLVKGEGKALVQGDVIQFKLNAKGKIDKIDVLFDTDAKATEFSKQVGEKMQLVYGKVTKKFTSSINVSVNDGEIENYSTADVKVYSYDSTKNSSKVTLSSAADIQRFDSENNNRVFIRIYDDIVKEIVIVK
ncbi:MAG: S-layer homology domain-containing protein [Clostridia bacterium]|nr:S-layer homology domain-containing protein [Clostridia bacterium]